jgi:uncharacterized protein YjeT (DUF2065 family)
MKFFLCVLGLVFVLEGIPYFAFPEKLKIYLLKMAEIPPNTLRWMGLAAIVLGLALVYAGRS